MNIEDQAQALLDLDDDDFDELIVAESKGEASWVTDIVETDVTACERWVERLQAKSQAACQQLASLRLWDEETKAELDGPQEYAQHQREVKRRRKAISYFREKIDQRLREAKTIRGELRREAHDSEHSGWYSIMLKVADHPAFWDDLDLDAHDRVVLARALELE